MKKTFLYVLVAVVLGVSVMLFPLWTFFKRYNEPGPIVAAPLKLGSFEMSVPIITPMCASSNWQNYTAERMITEGDTVFYNDGGQVQPATGSSILLSLQILAAGFIIAIGAYVFARRKLTHSSVGFHYTKS